MKGNIITILTLSVLLFGCVQLGEDFCHLGDVIMSIVQCLGDVRKLEKHHNNGMFSDTTQHTIRRV